MTAVNWNPVAGLSDNIVVDLQKCVFCGTCVETCILDNLRLQLAPCRYHCPLHTNCQGYVQLIARGDEKKAMAVLAETLPFPGVMGRVCSHPCENACTRKEVDGEPVAIRDLKRYLADSVPFPQVEVSAERPERVTIVGAGPAGAMAACQLRKQGFRVRVYDANERPGGMLAAVVPSFRLPLDVLDREFSLLERLGVELHLGTKVGMDVALSDLVETSDAVILATGAQLSKRLGIEGEDLAGVYSGLEFLRAAKSSISNLDVGKAVVVIGGGNTAVDAAQTAYRLGAEVITVVCLETSEEMPAFPEEVADACKEGISLLNGWGPVRFLSGNGRVKGVELRRCLRVFDSEGRFAPCFDDAQVTKVETDTVIVAIGQEADFSLLSEGVGSTSAVGSPIAVDSLTLQCASQAKLFAAGDVVTGARTAVEALASGREAAESVRRYLMGEDLRYGRSFLGPYELDFPVDKSKAIQRERVRLPELGGHERRSFAEVRQGLARETARAEAERCLSCGHVQGTHRSCWFCLPCEVECPEKALRVEIPFLAR